ncbi:MAG: hypothetical protein K6F99_02270 [Lachnospiraceae bacterium]|nr:hypothetical protein [Lachnospiraceae bacterium]
MDEIRSFVKIIYECVESNHKVMEEDQKLPDADVLESVCNTLLNVSTMAEELRYPSFRVCFIDRESLILDMYLHSHTVIFESALDFNTRELHRLAPALNPAMSYLLIDTSGDEYKIIGINASYTIWENIMLKEIDTGNRMPGIFNLYLKGPGEIDACFGESTLVRYMSGRCDFLRTDTFTKTQVAEELRRGSYLSEEDRLKVLYRILWKAAEYKHGGLIFIVPDEDSCRDYLTIKYKIPTPFAFGDHKKLGRHADQVLKKAVITYADLLAKFTSVDGALVLDKNLNLIGFGGETEISISGATRPELSFIGSDNKEVSDRRYDDNGMRHRACYHFCNYVEGAVAIIISQDGTVKACTKKGGKVLVYDDVALPLM